MTSTALTVRTETSPARHGLIRPVVKPVELIEAHKEAAAVIKDALEDGRDYGTIPNAGPRKVLLKPGAERLCVAFGLQPHFEIVVSEADHDREVGYYDYKRKRDATSRGLYRYVVRCTLERDGAVVGEGMGSCSTMESKYVSRPRDCENTVLKMAKKRAQVDAVLATLSLSDRFTQDVDDRDEEADAVARGRREESDVVDAEVEHAQPKKKVDLNAVLDLAKAICEAESSETLAWATTQIAGVAPEASNAEFGLASLINQRSAQLAEQTWTAPERAQKAAKWLRDELEKRSAAEFAARDDKQQTAETPKQ